MKVPMTATASAWGAHTRNVVPAAWGTAPMPGCGVRAAAGPVAAAFGAGLGLAAAFTGEAFGAALGVGTGLAAGLGAEALGIDEEAGPPPRRPRMRRVPGDGWAGYTQLPRLWVNKA